MTHRHLLFTAFLMISMFLPGCTAAESQSTPPGKIVFTSNRDGTQAVYSMNADGSNPTRLTSAEAGDLDPVWSVDGQKIYFVSFRDAKTGELYVMNPDGSSQTRLTTGGKGVDLFAVSPDGLRIAVQTHDPLTLQYSSSTSNQVIYVMNADGSQVTQLVSSETSLLNTGFAWSPDGSKITYVSLRDGKLGIYVINADGTGETLLTGQNDLDFNWSPDGKEITFISLRDGNAEVYVMNADGSGQTRLTNTPSDDRDPAWSPAGKRIAFISTRDGLGEMYTMNADGSLKKRLTNNTTDDYSPRWAADGIRILYVARLNSQNAQIYVVYSDATHPTNLTRNEAFNFQPAWGR